MIRFDAALEERVTANVSAFARANAPVDDSLRAAAVAVTIVGDDDGVACFLLTRRATGLRRHASQWAIPGGRIEPGEDPAGAALRELHEELGLSISERSVLGTLDDYPTRSGYLITPVVVWGPERPRLQPHPDEVESAHLIPFHTLDEPDVPRLLEGEDPQRPIIQLPLYGRFVHAPTAAILYQLREVALHARHTRVAHFDQPPFAWK